MKENNRRPVFDRLAPGDIEYQLQFEKTVADISNTFIIASSAETDQAIIQALQKCGELFEVERSYIFQFAEDGKTETNTHEWCAEGIEPQKEKMQNLPVNEFSWTLERIRRDGHVYVPEVKQLPPAAEQEKKFFLDNKICSLILIALTIEGEVRGFFGFDLPEGKRDWKSEQIALLKVVTGIIAGAIARYNSDQELHKSEEMFRSISENVYNLIALMDLKGNYLYCNLSYKKILGYEPKELIGKSAFEIIHPAEKNKVIHICREGSENGIEKADYLIRLICKDGSIKWVEHSMKLLYAAGGRPDRVLVVGQDISKRRQAEEQVLIQRNLGLKLAGTSDLQQALKFCLDAAIDVSGMDSGGMYLVDQNNGSLQLVCHKGLSSDFYNQCSYYQPGSPNAEIVKKGKPHYLVGADNFFKIDAARREGLTAAAILPINVEGQVYACLNVSSHSLNDIPTGTRVALDTIVSQVNVAIARLRAEQFLQKNVEKYQTLVSNVPGIIFSCAQDRNWTMNYISGDVEELTGYKASDFVGNRVRSFASIIHPEDREYVYNTISGHQEKRYPYHVRYRIITADQKIRWFRESGRPVYNKYNLINHLDGVIIDITELKAYEEQLKYLSLHDQLTGLFNRTFFETELSRLEGGREYPISIISTDLDGLKLINDTMGHAKGDQLLKASAKILQQTFRASDILARVGGDEFAAILPNTDSQTSESIARRIRENIAAFNKDNADLPLSLSLGLATAESSEISMTNLFKQADDLMYRDKLYGSFSTRSKVVNSLMSALAERDYITEGHAMRLEKLSLALGEKNNLSSRQLADLALLAQVHDLGKVGIPDHVLLKPGALNNDEWAVMKLHPEKGYRIALSSPELIAIADLILKHHEHWDGSGYPLGLKGEEIPLSCRILAIVDAFDAMTNDRPNKKAMSVDDAKLELLINAGGQFDPHLVEMFLALPEIENL